MTEGGQVQQADALREERQKALKQRRKDAKELMAVLGVESVVVVDDQARLTADLYISAFARDRERARLPADQAWDQMDDDQWRQQVRAWFDALDDEGQAKENRRALVQIARYGDVAAGMDLAFLRQLLEDVDLHVLLPAQWDEWKGTLTAGRADRVLVLFDRNLGGEKADAGIGLLAQYLEGNPEARAAVLTTEVKPDQEVTSLSRLTSAYPQVQPRTLLASKDRLTLERAESFLNLLRLTANIPALHELRDGFLAQAQSYQTTGREALTKIPIQVLEDIVFRSSLSEGAWEMDTLARVLGLLTQDAARKAMPGNAPDPVVLSSVRTLAAACTVTHEPSLEQARKIMRGERWTPIDYVNALGLPLANGDVFEFSERYWILMCQPCDLVVRNKEGDRKAANTVSLLPLELRGQPKINDEPDDETSRRRYHDLPFGFGDRNNRNLIMRFVPWLDVMVDVLDLCAFHPQGKAEFVFGAARPTPLTPGLGKLRDRLDDECAKTMQMAKRLRRLKNPNELLLRLLAVEPSGQLTPDLQATGSAALSYGCKRVARLAAPYADAALTAVSSERAREAHEHDLDRFGNPRAAGSA